MSLNSRYARRLRARIAGRQNNRCCYCRRPFTDNGPTRPTLEHLKPKMKGGRDAVSNLAVACLHCNQHRGRQILKTMQSAPK